MLESAMAMSTESVGQELQLLYVDPALTSKEYFTQDMWQDLLNGLFAHFLMSQVTQWKDVTKPQKRILQNLNHPNEKVTYTKMEVIERMANYIQIRSAM